MNFAKIFIRRPVLAMVISIVIVLGGAVSIFSLPVEQYPNITPPTVTVAANYVGASADVMEQSVAIPIEQSVNGAENMLYMSSRSTNSGSYTLTCTFDVGTDVNVAAMDVQNRVQQAQGNLPSEVLATGITVRKRSPSLLMLVSIYSPDASYDQLFLSNYAQIYVRDPLSRVSGVGDIQALGQEYSMRVWLQPDRMAALGVTASDVASAVRQQNVQAPAGQIGSAPAPAARSFNTLFRRKDSSRGPSNTRTSSSGIFPMGRSCACATSAAYSWAGRRIRRSRGSTEPRPHRCSSTSYRRRTHSKPPREFVPR